MDLELELFGDLKDKSGCSSALGKVYMLSLSSQPVDHEDASGERQKVSKILFLRKFHAFFTRLMKFLIAITMWAVVVDSIFRKLTPL